MKGFIKLLRIVFIILFAFVGISFMVAEIEIKEDNYLPFITAKLLGLMFIAIAILNGQRFKDEYIDK